MRFEFPEKGGKHHAVDVDDRRLAAVVRRCQDLPGHGLFQYLDESGARQTIDSADVNAYLREIGGADFTAKDFRTWFGTVLVARALGRERRPGAARAATRRIREALAGAARRLGNTPTICRRCYVHPAVVRRYLEGSPAGPGPGRGQGNGGPGLRPDEAAVLRFLERQRAPVTRAALPG